VGIERRFLLAVEAAAAGLPALPGQVNAAPVGIDLGMNAAPGIAYRIIMLDAPAPGQQAEQDRQHED